MPSPQQGYITVESSKFPTIKYSFFSVYIINGWDFNRDKGVAKREEKIFLAQNIGPWFLRRNTKSQRSVVKSTTRETQLS